MTQHAVRSQNELLKNGRNRPFDANSPVVIPSPTLPPTPQPIAKGKRSSIYGVADEILPVGLIRGSTPHLAKSPLSNVNETGTPRVSKTHGSPLPSQTELAVRAALSNQATKTAMMADMLRILHDPSKRLPTQPSHKRTSSGSSTPTDLLVHISKILAPTSFAPEDKEVASLVEHNEQSSTSIQKPSALREQNIAQLQQSFPSSSRRLQRSSNSAFSESSRSAHQ
jgi:hypothetical protein